jgi:hypothetical protein
VINLVRWAAAAAIAVALSTTASAAEFDMARSAPEFSQSAANLKKGEIFTTSGLVCDKPSDIDAVITLTRNGEPLNTAIEQINAGTEVPRCVVGRMLIAEYLGKVHTFSVDGQEFQIHHVQIIGLAIHTPHGVVSMRLKKPMEQFVVSSDGTQPT